MKKIGDSADSAHVDDPAWLIARSELVRHAAADCLQHMTRAEEARDPTRQRRLRRTGRA